MREASLSGGGERVADKKTKENYDLEFRPEEKQKTHKVVRFLLSFFLMVVALGLLSYAALRKNGIDAVITGQRGITQNSETTTQENTTTWGYNGAATLLLCALNEKGDALRYLCLVEADAAQKNAVLSPIAPHNPVILAGEEITPQAAYQSGGYKLLKAAAGAAAGVEIDRYISATDEEFIRVVNMFGAVTVDVPARVQHRSAAFSLTLGPGQQRLQGDLLLRYIRYLLLDADTGAEAVTEVAMRICRTAFLTQSPDGLQDTFDALVNILRTDVSARDFYDCLPLLKALAQENSLTFAVKEKGA
jgi:anionic cell wall polymer biosynthesis LytR-Cps2A-Psr (LCP) family protein